MKQKNKQNRMGKCTKWKDKLELQDCCSANEFTF